MRPAEMSLSPSLAQRRQALLVRSALLREQVASDVQALRPVWLAADRVQDGVTWVRQHPLWVGVAVALLVAWRPRKTLWAGWRLWGWWQTARRWMDLVKK